MSFSTDTSAATRQQVPAKKIALRGHLLRDADTSMGGTLLGYGSSARRLVEQLERTGWTIADDADTVLHYNAPFAFRPVAGKRNILFTMWESEDFSEEVAGPHFAEADAIFTPSKWCATLFARYASAPIWVVPLGFDDKVYKPFKRTMKSPFRFLWIGAPNYRKGWHHIHGLWESCYQGMDVMQLYLKTTDPDPSVDGELMREGNVILDTRMLPLKDLVTLYKNCDAFVFPTSGEGFGLTLLEAMATGMPCITTRYSGVLEFTNSQIVRYVDYKMDQASVIDGAPELMGQNMSIAVPDHQQMASAMEWCITRFSAAHKMGMKAARHVHRLYTWERTGEQLDVALRSAMKVFDRGAQGVAA